MSKNAEKKTDKKSSMPVTAEMLAVGQIYKLDKTKPAVQIVKLTKQSVTISCVAWSKDHVHKINEFLEMVNAVEQDGTVKPGLQKPPEKKSDKKPESKPEPQKPPQDKIIKGTQSLAVILTPELMNQRIRELGNKLQLHKEKVDEKLRVTQQLGGEIKTLAKEIASLETAITEGKEMQDVAIETRYNYVDNKKTITRLDTKEVIKDTAIPPSESQMDFI